MAWVNLPTSDRRIERHATSLPRDFALATPAIAATAPRIFYSAAHVVADPFADVDPWTQSAIDWDTTLAYRDYLYGLGLGVAEAMDTAQRGSGLDWPAARQLITRSVARARSIGPSARIASGAGTDHLDPAEAPSLAQITDAYLQQCEAVEAAGGRIILMASRALAAAARSPDDYAQVYDHVLSQVREPVIIHWLGEMFDPALAGYWGHADHAAAMDVAVDVIARHAPRIDGVKISLLSKEKEVAMRRRLPAGVRMYTGDDFNYADLIEGDDQGYSDALLGIFAAIAPAASAALAALCIGDMAAFRDILAPTVPLSRHIFRDKTRFYKTGVVFMAYLNGHQSHFSMIGGQQSARSALHLAELFRLADAAGLWTDPDRAAARMATVMAGYGIDPA